MSDAALEWSRAHCAETSHTTPRISLLTQSSSFAEGSALLAPVLAFARADPVLEREHIASAWSVHVRVAFEADDRLEVVPASHARWDTAEELLIRKGSQRTSASMPNAVRIALRPGDACLFHSWSIHRATYRRAPIRRTLDLLYAATTSPK